MTNVEVAQKILADRWRHAGAALRACREQAWPAFARSVAPPRPLLAGRLDHGRCLALAEATCTGPETTTLAIVPLWACSTDDATSTAWAAVHGVLPAGGALYVQEVGPFIDAEDASPRADALFECTVRKWSAAVVVESRSYAPSIGLKLRAGRFGVAELEMIEVVSVDVRASAPLPRPTREVPMFAHWLEPRAGVSPELEAKIRDLCFTAQEEDE